MSNEYFLYCQHRLLGYTDVQLHEAVLKGRQTVNASLTGKKEDQLEVSDCYWLELVGLSLVASE